MRVRSEFLKDYTYRLCWVYFDVFLRGSSGGLGPLVPCREGEGLVHTAIPGRRGTTLSRSLCAAWFSTGAFPEM